MFLYLKYYLCDPINVCGVLQLHELGKQSLPSRRFEAKAIFHTPDDVGVYLSCLSKS